MRDRWRNVLSKEADTSVNSGVDAISVASASDAAAVSAAGHSGAAAGVVTGVAVTAVRTSGVPAAQTLSRRMCDTSSGNAAVAAAAAAAGSRQADLSVKSSAAHTADCCEDINSSNCYSDSDDYISPDAQECMLREIDDALKDPANVHLRRRVDAAHAAATAATLAVAAAAAAAAIVAAAEMEVDDEPPAVTVSQQPTLPTQAITETALERGKRGRAQAACKLQAVMRDSSHDGDDEQQQRLKKRHNSARRSG
jgi:hypothetical protein